MKGLRIVRAVAQHHRMSCAVLACLADHLFAMRLAAGEGGSSTKARDAKLSRTA